MNGATTTDGDDEFDEDKLADELELDDEEARDCSASTISVVSVSLESSLTNRDISVRTLVINTVDQEPSLNGTQSSSRFPQA